MNTFLLSKTPLRGMKIGGFGGALRRQCFTKPDSLDRNLPGNRASLLCVRASARQSFSFISFLSSLVSLYVKRGMIVVYVDFELDSRRNHVILA